MCAVVRVWRAADVESRHKEHVMAGSMKKVVGLLLVVFLLFYMFTDPGGLATLAKDGGTALWELIQQLFAAIIRFLNAMTS